jgi:dienelactone hydrolase
VFRDWPMADEAKISNDGKYVIYKISHLGYANKQGEIVIQSVSSSWKKVLTNPISDAYFSSDSRKAVIKISTDSLAIINLGSNTVLYLTDISVFNVIENQLYYRQNKKLDVLNVKSLSKDENLIFNNVKDYLVNERNKQIILIKMDSVSSYILSYYDLKKKTSFNFWRGRSLSNLIFNNYFECISFMGEKDSVFGIYIFDFKTNNTRLLVDSRKAGIDTSLEIKEILKFSSNDHFLFFNVGMKVPPKIPNISSRTNAKVSIWSYKDVMLKSEVDIIGKPTMPNSIFVVNLKTGKVLELTKGNETLYSHAGDYVVIQRKSGFGDPEEDYWNSQSQISFFLVYLADGHRENLLIDNPILSHEGHYILYYEPQNCDLYTYETSTGKTYNITRKVTRKGVPDYVKYNSEFSAGSIFGNYWLDNDSAVLVNSERDIWILNSKGEKDALNVTNSYGAKYNTVFRATKNLSNVDFHKTDGVIFSGFNLDTKENGFFRIYLNKIKNPQKLIMDNYVFCIPSYPIENGYNTLPIKAKQSNVWLVKRMKSNESPNYFITKDFRFFSEISHIYPEKKYNWLTTELHSWKMFNGDSAYGILYLPENFDSHRKYPIIFHYYMQFSFNLNSYLEPAASIGPINIPWYVSHGYLVFVPDIIHTPGATGYSAYNSVVSAAMYMKKKPYVDSAKMGLQGHSFGGYQTNYIITKTPIFAAACSSSGLSDLVSFAGLLGSTGNSNHFMASKGQPGMVVRLWDDPGRYIENSPLFYLDKVTTPLLAMHTTGDKAVNFTQALELFNGLRQFKKKIWLLIYDGENHVLLNENNAMDYTERQKQFFDFYLKGAVEPDWMKDNL